MLPPTLDAVVVTEGRFGAAAVTTIDGELVITRPENWDLRIVRNPRAEEIDSVISGPIDVVTGDPAGWQTHLEIDHLF